MASLKVVAPLVVLHGKDDKHHYVYAGGVVEPSMFDGEQIRQLKEDGSLGSEKDLAAAQENDEPEQAEATPRAPRRTSK